MDSDEDNDLSVFIDNVISDAALHVGSEKDLFNGIDRTQTASSAALHENGK